MKSDTDAYCRINATGTDSVCLRSSLIFHSSERSFICIGVRNFIVPLSKSPTHLFALIKKNVNF